MITMQSYNSVLFCPDVQTKNRYRRSRQRSDLFIVYAAGISRVSSYFLRILVENCRSISVNTRKMPNAGFVTILIGVTVATVLYFMFGTNKPRTAQQYYEQVFEYHSERPNRFDSEECSICLLPLINKATCILSCKHQFHKNCIDRWRHQAQGHQASCPLCRSPFT